MDNSVANIIPINEIIIIIIIIIIKSTFIDFKLQNLIHINEFNVTPRHRWVDNIRMDRTEIDVSTRNWVDSALDRDY